MIGSPKFLRKLFQATLAIGMLAANLFAGSVQAAEPAPGPVETPAQPVKADPSSVQQGMPAPEGVVSDLFGYFLVTTTPAWFDATASGTPVDFTTRDDDYAGPIQIGFSFKFYEQTFSELYISTNGIITFGKESDEFVNRPMPRDTYPDNIIAPFWDDLIMLVGQGGEKISQVFVQTIDSPTGKYFVVQWNQFARIGSNDLITFQAILHENGDIVIQYLTLTGVLTEATVGIEDAHGSDGLQYLYNAPGLSTATALRFVRPPAAYRVKLTPVYISGFTISQQVDLTMTIINSGELGADSYTLSWLPDQPGWQAEFYDADGEALHSAHGENTASTGTVAQGESYEVKIRLLAPSNAGAGSYTHGVLQAVSNSDNLQRAQITIQAAVPAPFAQAYFDAELGMRLQLTWQETSFSPRISEEQFTGSNISMTQMPGGNYFYAWEKNISVVVSPTLTLFHTNLEFTILNRFGRLLAPARKLTDNASALVKTEDRFLTLAGLPDGRVGAIWVRILTQGLTTNQNVYFAVLDSSGNTIVPALRLTDNNAWRGRDDYDVPVFVSPRIAATGDTHFVLAWNDERSFQDGNSSDIYLAVYDSTGSAVSLPAAITQSQHGGIRYRTPAIVALQDGRSVVAYVRLDPGDPLNPVDDQTQTVYQLIDVDGAMVRSETDIVGSHGSTTDGIQLNNGEVFLAWNVPNSNAIEYAMLSGANMDVAVAPVLLDEPKGRAPGVVSVSGDGFGRAVLTWAEVEQSNYLGYALIDGSGAVVTPPMIFQYGAGSNPTISTNMYGWGNAAYDGAWQTFLPLLRR